MREILLRNNFMISHFWLNMVLSTFKMLSYRMIKGSRKYLKNRKKRRGEIEVGLQHKILKKRKRIKT